MIRLIALLLWAALAEGCFLFNTPDEDGGPDANAEAGTTADGGRTDAGPEGGTFDAGDLDAGDCFLGSTRLCDPYCDLRCPIEAPLCHDRFSACGVATSSDPRGREECVVSLEFGNDYCYTGALCATRTRPGPSWEGGGACVDEAYCRWVLDRPELEDVRCRYSEGTLFVDGPPDHECVGGGDPASPLCGGRCGDTCPVGFMGATFGRPACVGLSETRGFGVCVPAPRMRCEADVPEALPGQLDECAYQSGRLRECVCMVLSPVELPEFADHGWGVGRTSCLAYRARYPGEVRCVDASGVDL